jgi:uncharacterized protein (DUF952 family)
MAIYHLVWESDWKSLTKDGLYRPASLTTEGFVHCTREPEKLVEVANLFFNEDRGEPLLLLTLDESNLASEVKYEDPGVGHLFPHVYGPLEVAAVTKQSALRRVGNEWKLPQQ